VESHSKTCEGSRSIKEGQAVGKRNLQCSAQKFMLVRRRRTRARRHTTVLRISKLRRNLIPQNLYKKGGKE